MQGTILTKLKTERKSPYGPSISALLANMKEVSISHSIERGVEPTYHGCSHRSSGACGCKLTCAKGQGIRRAQTSVPAQPYVPLEHPKTSLRKQWQLISIPDGA